MSKVKKIQIPNMPNSIAHPQAVWFECHWLPIFERQQKVIEGLRDYVEDLNSEIQDLKYETMGDDL